MANRYYFCYNQFKIGRREEIGTDPSLFDGLSISNNQELCQEYMGKYPVVSISLKGVDASSFEDARKYLARIISEEANRLHFLENSDNLTANDKSLFHELTDYRMCDATDPKPAWQCS